MAECSRTHDTPAPPESATVDGGVGRGTASGTWFQDMFEDLLHDRLFLPSLPDVISRVRQALDAAPTGIETIARIVEIDPAIAAEVIKIANICDRTPVESCLEAVTRLEVQTTRLLIHTSAVHEPFRGDSSLLRECLREVYQHSTKVAAICHVLARMTPHLAPEEALLAGLLHRAGELAMIKYLDRQPELTDDAARLQGLFDELAPEAGEALLRKWHFADGLVEVAARCHDWSRDGGRDTDLCDLVIVARLHSYMGTPKIADVPPVSSIPALAKLGRLDAKLSLGILNEANSQLAQANACWPLAGSAADSTGY